MMMSVSHTALFVFAVVVAVEKDLTLLHKCVVAGRSTAGCRLIYPAWETCS